LDALVPDYLPRVPLDPFRADQGPLSYLILPGALPDGRDRPLVYHVSEDGQDQIKSNAASILGVPQYDQSPLTPDEYRDLERWAPPPAATQQSVEEP
jgi:hypothetical protein